jgi:rare lipoprotein A
LLNRIDSVASEKKYFINWTEAEPQPRYQLCVLNRTDIFDSQSGRVNMIRTNPDLFRKNVATLVAVALTWAASMALSPAANKTSGKATVESKSFSGGKTASGQRYNPHEMVAASRTLPIGSKVKVENKKTGKCATVKINDRTAKNTHNVVDLSSAAADKLGVKGTAKVDAKVVK